MGMISKIENVCWLGDNARLYAGTILLKDGRIEKFQGERLARNMRPDEPLLLPGLVDAHVHLREPGQTYKEGIANGTAAALQGGVTTVLDMPNNVPPCITADDLVKKRKLFAQKSRVNYGLFLQAAADVPASPVAGIAGVKVYMAQSSAAAAIQGPEALERVFRGQRRVVVHAEDETHFVAPRGRKAMPHHERRPKAAVIAALDTIAKAYVAVQETRRPRLVLAHCSTQEEVEWVARMKRSGHDVWAETCPHYFLFTQEDYLAQGSRLQVNPPLRSESDRAAVWEALKNGIIDFVSTDHAPHAPKEKAGASAPSGIAGVEWLAPLLVTLAVKKEISWSRYLELAGQQAAKCFDIRDRGWMKPGYWADFVRMAEGPPTHKIVTRAEWNPYVDFDFAMHVQDTMVNGVWGLLNGRMQRNSHGKEVYV